MVRLSRPGQGGAAGGTGGGDDQGGQVRQGLIRGQDVLGGGDELAVQAEAGADDGAVQAAGFLQEAAQLAGRRAGGGADLVADHGPALGQRLVQDAGAAVEGDEGDGFGALGQREAGPGGQVLHGGDARDRLHRHLGYQGPDGLGQVAEGGVEIGVAEGAEGDRGRAFGELLGNRGRGRVPGGGPARRDAAGVVQRELKPPDPVGGDVLTDDRLGPALLASGGTTPLGPPAGLARGEHGDQHYV